MVNEFDKKVIFPNTVSKVRANINKYILTELNKLGIENIAVSHGNILAILCKNESMTMKEIAKAIKRDASTVTTLVKKLEVNGYVKVYTKENDTRSKIVQISEKSLAIKNEFDQITKDLSSVIWNGLNNQEIEVLLKCMDTINNNLERTLNES